MSVTLMLTVGNAMDFGWQGGHSRANGLSWVEALQGASMAAFNGLDQQAYM